MMVLILGLSDGGKVRVSTGIDVLEANKFEQLQPNSDKPRRIAVLTNQSGVTFDGRRTIDVLAGAPGIKLVAIFSPEHGLAGNEDREGVPDATDAATKLPIYSLYGKGKQGRRPQAEVLKQVDGVVVDLQDVGARFYTYASSLGYLLEEAAKTGTEVVVLDRPNPINGTAVEGPVSDAEPQSFVNYHPVPVRHGMTMGELAKMFNTEKKIGAKLTVVAMRGWEREMWFDETGLAWVNPSPAIRNVTQATLYPGTALLEHTNVSVGRGTETPFEVVGAPWIEGAKLTEFLLNRRIAGVKFEIAMFTPVSSTHKGMECQGVRVSVLDRNLLNAPLLGLEVSHALRVLYPEKFEIEKMKALVANAAVLRLLKTGKEPREIAEEHAGDLRRFVETRQQYLLY
jgi:uncharacterized protein YbbC (DUF1343 family)